MSAASSPKGGVQSIERLFEILEAMASAGGEIGLTEMATATGLATPTIYRLLQTPLSGGYVVQQPSRRYALGPSLIRLGESAQQTIGGVAQPILKELAEDTGETVNLAMLDRDEAVYLAQAPSRHSMRMFTEVGRRVSLHSTGVGKILLAQLGEERVRDIVARLGLPARTEKTISTLPELLIELDRIREVGYALDDGEQELGVRCVAVGVTRHAPMVAISVSAPEFRLSLTAIDHIVPRLHEAAKTLAISLGETGDAPFTNQASTSATRPQTEPASAAT